MLGKSFTQKIVIRIQLTYVERAMLGSVIMVSCCHLLAPSMLEASYNVGSTAASAADIMTSMNGNPDKTMNRQRVTFAIVGSVRNSGSPSPRSWTSLGIGLSLVAMSQFHAVVETTTGTTQGSMSSTLNTVAPGTDVRSSSASARPTSQLPKTAHEHEDQSESGRAPEVRVGEDVTVVGEARPRSARDQRAVVHRLGKAVEQWISVDRCQHDHRRRHQDDQRRGTRVRAEWPPAARAIVWLMRGS